MDLISVIVPVYKVEKFLDKCIESIAGQTYKNIEIILVDDGSPDQSGKICDMWAKKDSRINVIHQQNSGGGYARNVALEQAKGNFIAFVDSDDYIAPQMFEYLLGFFEKDKNIDIVECSYSSFTEIDVPFDKLEIAENITMFSTIEAMRENISDCYFRQLIWNKLYRREVIGDIRFPVGKKIDDEFWTYQVLGNAKKLLLSNKILYAYRQQTDSVMHSMGADKRIQVVEARCERHKYVKANFPELEDMSCCSLWNACIYQGQITLRQVKKKERKNIFIYLQSIIKKYPISISQCRGLPNKQKIWLQMAKISLLITCQIRNVLRVGM